MNPLAGERVPDVDGLYDELDLARLTVFAGDAAVVAAAAGWADVVTVRDARSDGWMLVRPDGYLAAAGADVDELEQFLKRWFLTP